MSRIYNRDGCYKLCYRFNKTVTLRSASLFIRRSRRWRCTHTEEEERRKQEREIEKRREMEQGAPVELTSGASGRIIPVIRKVRRSAPTPDSLLRALIFLHSLALWFLLLIRRRSPLFWKATATSAVSQAPPRWRNGGGRWSAAVEDEDARRRRELAEETKMGSSSEEGAACRCETFVFEGPRRNSLFCRSWLPSSGDLR